MFYSRQPSAISGQQEGSLDENLFTDCRSPVRRSLILSGFGDPSYKKDSQQSAIGGSKRSKGEVRKPRQRGRGVYVEKNTLLHR